MDFLSAALKYARAGKAVFPLVHSGKAPLVDGGFKAATTDEIQLRQWATAWPEANIGLPTSEANGIFAVDLDNKNGVDGSGSWAMLMAEHGPVATRTIRTPSGGEHIYFKWPAGGLARRIKVRPGLDIMGAGGYVVAVPSETDLGSYTVSDPSPIAEAPPWVLALATEPAAPAKRTLALPLSVAPIREGDRNERLFKIAAGCKAEGYSESEILARLRTVNAESVEPRLDDAELVGIARSTGRYPAGKPPVTPADDPQHYNPTDLGNACRLADRYAGRIHWLTDSQSWLAWDGKRFRRDPGELVMQAAQECVRSLYVEAANAGSSEERKSLAEYAIKCEREAKLKSAVSLARSQPRIMSRSTAFDLDPDLVNVGNGTIHLPTATLQPYSQADRLTKLTDIDYDPDATAPTWDAFLNRIMNGRTELVEYLRRAVGYSLTGHTREHCLFMLHGTGANGKSTFDETLCDVFGEYSMRTQFSTWTATERGEATHEIAALAGARLVVSNEAEGGSRLAEALVKQATGGDRMRGCFKYQNSFEFVPALKLWIALNHKPTIRGTDEGIWRRIRLIPFDVTIPAAERDPSLREKLRAELPGILAWAVRGAFEWYCFGLADPEAVLSATREYRQAEDFIGDWCEQFLIPAELGKLKKSAAYESFKSWAEREGVRPMSAKKLGMLLKERGLTEYKDRTGQRFWCDVELWDGVTAVEGRSSVFPGFSL